MPAFILRDLNPEFWARVQAKAALEGTTVKALILRLLGQWLAASLVVFTIGCAYKNPIAPTSTADTAKPGVPTRIELSANPGLGADAGTGAISARVFDGLSTALSNQTVTFSASTGTLSAAQVSTDEKGVARATITGPAGAAIVISATVGTVEQKTQIAMQAGPAAPPASTPPIFPPPSPPQPPAPPTPPTPPSFTVILTASPTELVVNNSATLTAAVVLHDGATAPTGYAWDCNGDGTAETTTTVNVTACPYATAGTIKSAVRVTGANASALASVDVTVAAAAPLAVAITGPSPIAINASATFTATMTSAGPVPTTGLNWEWDDNGDATVDQFSAGHTNPDTRTTSYGSVGEKTIKVKVTDTATGRTAIGTRTVTVQ